MRSADEESGRRATLGGKWMLFAAFLIAFVQPVCAWECAFLPLAATRYNAPASGLAAVTHVPVAHVPVAHVPVAHVPVAHVPVAHAHRPAEPDMPPVAHSCCEPKQKIASGNSGEPHTAHHHSGSDHPAERHSCCDSHADAFKAAVEVQLNPQSPTSYSRFSSIIAILPLIALRDTVADLIPSMRDGTRSTLPSLLLVSSLLRRGPPALA